MPMSRPAAALAALALSVGLAVGVAPAAQASVANGAFCEPVGWTTHWKAKKFYDGEFVGYGPLRFRRATAWRDCDAYMS
jgi:hypothetical protein